MKALRITEPGKTEIVELPQPTPGTGEVLLRVRIIGYCGSDLSTFLGRNPLVAYPRIPGHEISATVVTLGSGVPETITVGTDVTVVPYTHCGICAACRRQRANACRGNQTLGVQRDGALAEFLVVPWPKLVIAPGLSPLQLALVEPLTVGFHAADRGRVDDTDTVMVIGCGMIGLGAIARAVNRGANVIAVDVDNAKLAIAREIGARHAVNSRESDLGQQLQTLTDGHGPDVIIEAVGSPATYRAAVEHVGFTGRVVCIGYAKEEVPLPTRLFVQKELDILGSRNATPRDFAAVTTYLRQGRFPIERVITTRVALAEAGAALQRWADQPAAVTKILVDVG